MDDGIMTEVIEIQLDRKTIYEKLNGLCERNIKVLKESDPKVWKIVRFGPRYPKPSCKGYRFGIVTKRLKHTGVMSEVEYPYAYVSYISENGFINTERMYLNEIEVVEKVS